MQTPNINNFIKDPNGGKYNVVAYRKLFKNEIIEQVRSYLSTKNAKKPKKGQTISIVTIIGYDQ